MEPMDELSALKISEAYDAAMQGADEPEVIAIKCPTCGQSFLLVKGKGNEVCEHLLERIRQTSQL